MKIKLIIALSIMLLAAGCGDSERQLNGKYVMTTDGRIFQVVHNVGDTYFLRAVDIEQLKTLNEQFELAKGQSK